MIAQADLTLLNQWNGCSSLHIQDLNLVSFHEAALFQVNDMCTGFTSGSLAGFYFINCPHPKYAWLAYDVKGPTQYRIDATVVTPTGWVDGAISFRTSCTSSDCYGFEIVQAKPSSTVRDIYVCSARGVRGFGIAGCADTLLEAQGLQTFWYILTNSPFAPKFSPN